MTKAELVAKITEGADLTKIQSEKMVEVLVKEIIGALKAGDKVALVGFGTFSAVSRAARTGRNPSTGAPIKIAAKTNGKFTPGQALKDLNASAVKVAKPVKVSAKPAGKAAAKAVKAPAKKK